MLDGHVAADWIFSNFCLLINFNHDLFLNLNKCLISLTVNINNPTFLHKDSNHNNNLKKMELDFFFVKLSFKDFAKSPNIDVPVWLSPSFSFPVILFVT